MPTMLKGDKIRQTADKSADKFRIGERTLSEAIFWLNRRQKNLPLPYSYCIMGIYELDITRNILYKEDFTWLQLTT